jgi:hypothetical protein
VFLTISYFVGVYTKAGWDTQVPVPFPEASNCLLAVIENLGVSCIGVSLSLRQYCFGLQYDSYGNTVAISVASVKLAVNPARKSL